MSSASPLSTQSPEAFKSALVRLGFSPLLEKVYSATLILRVIFDAADFATILLWESPRYLLDQYLPELRQSC
ncbi:MAG: hypothetical protein IPG31_00925 [Nitrosomonas sp.]|nr:hypothetical protein [Nitrosomonas sp.]